MIRGSPVFFVLGTFIGANLLDAQQSITQLYSWNQVVPVNQWQYVPYVYHPVFHPAIHYNTLVPSYYVPDLKATRKETCAPLSLKKCQREAQLCLDLAIDLRDSFSTYSSVVGCATQNGIGLFNLLAANSPSKTNAEVLRDAGADKKTATAIFRCVLNQLGFAKNDILDVVRVKTVLRPIISQNILKLSQEAATLAALKTCPQPDIDELRGYVICIASACVKGR